MLSRWQGVVLTVACGERLRGMIEDGTLQVWQKHEGGKEGKEKKRDIFFSFDFLFLKFSFYLNCEIILF